MKGFMDASKRASGSRIAFLVMALVIVSASILPPMARANGEVNSRP